MKEPTLKKEQTIKVIVNSDHTIQDYESLARYSDGVVKNTLNRFAEQLTRVEVHVGDENGRKGGPDDKRCTMEARLEGMQPVAVTYHAANTRQAVDGAADKLAKLIENTQGRIQDKKKR